MFDVKDFYPSISETLLKEAINFAKIHVNIQKKDIDTIIITRNNKPIIRSLRIRIKYRGADQIGIAINEKIYIQK